MILNASSAEEDPEQDLERWVTGDGSPTLISSAFGEAFHSLCGALREAEWKFVAPAELHGVPRGSQLRVLDVCVGLGYNSACLMESADAVGLTIHWRGLESDPRPLALALDDAAFRDLWPARQLERLIALRDRGGWRDGDGEGQLLLGDARQEIQRLKAPDEGFDLILLDPFSPRRCPQLWSVEFLGRLAERLSPAGRLLTYSRAAAVRGSLRAAGLSLFSLQPEPGQRQDWSGGTLAIRSPGMQWSTLVYPPGHNSRWRALSAMEEEHLCTCASIPYRDPSGRASAEEILERRRLEQQQSPLEGSTA